MYGNLLPVGSVVLLKGADKRIMIIGRIVSPEGSKKVFDYSAVYYPEGLLDVSQMVFFDNDDIELLYFVGFQDTEELQFRSEVLGSLGELYVTEDGKIAEREPQGPDADMPPMA